MFAAPAFAVKRPGGTSARPAQSGASEIMKIAGFVTLGRRAQSCWIGALGVALAGALACPPGADGVGLAEPGQVGFQQPVTADRRGYSVVPQRSADADHHGDLACWCWAC